MSSSIISSNPSAGSVGRLAALLSACAAVLGAVALANLLVDPFGLFPGVHLEGWREYESRRGSRVAKAEGLVRGGFGAALFGTSRTEAGLDPRHPGVRPQPAYNAALAGTSMAELRRVYPVASAHNRLGLAVFALDFLMFTERGGFGDDFSSSRFATSGPPALRWLDHLLSHRALTATLDSLKQAVRGRPTNYDEFGFRARGQVATRQNTVQISAGRIRRFLTGPTLFGDFRLSEDHLGALSAIVRARTARRDRTVVLVPPVHALILETIRAAGLWPEFERFKRALAGLDALGAVVYDFTGYNEFTTEPLPLDHPDTDMQWYWEVSHFRRELGDRALDLALGEPADPARLWPTSFGQRLTPTTIEPHLARITAERSAWLAGAADQLAWFEGVTGVRAAPE